jgi:hypothetical protein
VPSGDSAASDTASDVAEQPGPPLAHALAHDVDVVEQALADALTRAAAAGEFDTVAALTAELRARREARSGVVSLDAERAKRDGKR